MRNPRPMGFWFVYYLTIFLKCWTGTNAVSEDRDWCLSSDLLNREAFIICIDPLL
jgi:hypothetical protein